ncbi:hypothetical protein SAMN05421544_1051, partial [Riemerella columbipharyngis]
PAYADNYVVPAEHTEDGVSRVVNLSWPEQAYTTSTKFIVATVKSVGGDLKVKKLDLNSGVGNDYQGNLLAQFDLVDNASVQLRAISGIPDRCAGIPTTTCAGYNSDHASTEKEHNFVYVPITLPDGSIWLNNVLGAAYTDVDNPTYFNPNHEAGAYDRNGNLTQDPTTADIEYDWRARGSLFQYGRRADGHELIKWYSETKGVPKYEGAGSLADSYDLAKTNKFIPNRVVGGTSTQYQWVTDDYAINHRNSVSGNWFYDSYSPCPAGFKPSVRRSVAREIGSSYKFPPMLYGYRYDTGEVVPDSNNYTSWGYGICGYPLRYDPTDKRYYCRLPAFDDNSEIKYIKGDTLSGSRDYIVYGHYIYCKKSS